MSKEKLSALLVIIMVAVVYFGFRLVTQSGLQGDRGSIQNDGYAVSGGLLILVAGLVLGWLMKERSSKKK